VGAVADLTAGVCPGGVAAGLGKALEVWGGGGTPREREEVGAWTGSGIVVAVVLIGQGAGKRIGGLFPKPKRWVTTRNCFVAGTLVLTEGGLVNIEDVAPGDRVLARDERTGEESWRPVTRTHERASEELVALALSSGSATEVIEATPTHPFWLAGHGWVFAGDLAEGDTVLASGHRALTVERAERVAGGEAVYNLSVEGLPNFFVGELGAWVHNTNLGPLSRRNRGQGRDPYATTAGLTLESTHFTEQTTKGTQDVVQVWATAGAGGRTDVGSIEVIVERGNPEVFIEGVEVAEAFGGRGVGGELYARALAEAEAFVGVPITSVVGDLIGSNAPWRSGGSIAETPRGKILGAEGFTVHKVVGHRQGPIVKSSKP